ncbi:MAG: PAS domain S-box protein, partial [Desulfatiglandaceae bacterium]
MTSEKSLTQSREYDENIINTVREPLIVLNQDLRVLSVSRSFYGVFKVKPEETVGQLIYDLGNKQWDIPKLRELLETILPQKTSFDDYEVEHDFATIGRRVMLLNARQIEQTWGKERIILLAIEDITERRRLEDLLEESEKRYRCIFETATDGIVLLEKREGHIVHANPAAVKMLGYSEAEYIGKMLKDIGVPIDMDDFPTIMESLKKSGILNYEDVPIKSKSGQDVHADIYMVNRAKLAQCNIRDVSERKLADKIFKEEKKFIENALNTLKDLFFVFDLEGKFLRWNQRISAVTGYTDREISLMKVTDFFRNDEKERVSKAILEGIKKGSASLNATLVAKDERQIPYEFSAAILNDVQNKPIGLSGIGRDITERKQIEEALINSERKWRNVLINTPQIGISLNPDAKIVFANAHFQKITGWKREEIIGQDWFDMFIPENIREEIRAIFKRNMHDKDTSGFSTYENDIVIKNGELRHIAWSNVLTKDAHGQISDITCLGVDLTESKQAEDVLKKSETRLRSIFQASPLGIGLISKDRKMQWHNETAARMLGYSSEEIDGKNARVLFASDEEFERVGEAINTLGPGKKTSEIETQWVRKEGSTFDCHISYALLDPESKNSVTLAMIEDITEQKKAEEEKRKLETQLNQAQKMEAIGVLAGGVAHDFNNILTAIIGNAELALMDLDKDTSLYGSIDEIRKAGHRAATLTRQLLAFSRKELIRP